MFDVITHKGYCFYLFVRQALGIESVNSNTSASSEHNCPSPYLFQTRATKEMVPGASLSYLLIKHKERRRKRLFPIGAVHRRFVDQRSFAFSCQNLSLLSMNTHIGVQTKTQQRNNLKPNMSSHTTSIDKGLINGGLSNFSASKSC